MTPLYQTLKTMLKPLVSLLIKQQVTYIAFLDLLKEAYVEVAEKSFTLTAKKQTDSRISLLTGVHRKEVKRIRENIALAPSDKEIKASKAAQMMALWTGHQAFLNEQGQPSALFRQTSEGEPSFESLVKKVSKDKHPRSILDEWLNQGLVRINTHDQIELIQAGYVPSKDFEEKLFFAGKNIGEHLAVVAHNLAGESPALFDRAIYYHHLSPESVKQLEQTAKQKLMQLLTELNQQASELQEKDASTVSEQASYSIHLGGYFYHNLS